MKNLPQSGVRCSTRTALPSFNLFHGSILGSAPLIDGGNAALSFESAAPSMEPYHILNQGLIYVLITDFLVRFVIQTATSHEIKPYLLMPVKKKN